ncbi:winged helix-turn-helix transcriptional regulator [Novosphingobium aquimarinum]|uniref:winged helix-turn-helix transcriptional regulator n=1 Tax=Novosphingobium aquimarinum TaxID=2682494 RepID=UPI0012EBBF99|nr:winged helix-turn-helix transcriptional regulator [Novosphingobium aquimarinum]
MKLPKETEGPEFHGKWYDDACGAAFAMELIGERWSIPIVRELMLGGRRFSDIRASLPGLSAKVLTERLERFEASGILHRTRSPPPASAQLYELTEWGRELEKVTQALGRWAVRSTLHNPRLPLTPVAFMLSLRTMIDRDAAEDLDVTVRFEIGDDGFFTQLAQGELDVRRTVDGEHNLADLVLRAGAAGDFLACFYGKQPIDSGLIPFTYEGDKKLLERFIACFRLPSKISGSRG